MWPTRCQIGSKRFQIQYPWPTFKKHNKNKVFLARAKSIDKNIVFGPDVNVSIKVLFFWPQRLAFEKYL